MFAVGHLSIGYLLAKGSGKLLNQDINLPLVFVLSLLPDIDILIPTVQHRTLTHSIILTLVASLPFFAYYKTKAIPYFAALAQHTLIGDFITGGAEGFPLFWPITQTSYGLPLDVFSLTNIALEWATFLLALTVMLKTRDLQKLFKHKPSHLALLIPASTVLLPSFFRFPTQVPSLLLLPHLAYLTLFSLSMLTALALSVNPTA